MASSTSSTVPAISRKPIRRRGRRHRHLVRGIQDSGGAAARLQRLPRQAQRREAHRGRAPRSRAGRAPQDPAAATASACGSARPAQWAIGVRMSGVPSWASTRAVGIAAPCRGRPIAGAPAPRSAPPAPGTAGRPRSARGPCSSCVALSTEILAPIDQIGCFTAISGVAARHRRRASAVRNGPPEAVSTIFSISAGCLRVERLEDGVVLGVDRQQRGAVRAAPRPARSRRRRPASPCWPAPRRRRAAAPPASDAARQRRRSPPWSSRPGGRRPRPRPAGRPRPRCRCRPAPPAARRRRAGSATTARSGVQRDGLLGQQLDIAAGDQGLAPGNAPGWPVSRSSVWVPTCRCCRVW